MLRPIYAAASLVLSAFVASSAYAGEAGRIILVAGSAQVGDRAAVLNAPVQEGDMLVTGKDGYIYVKTIDNGLFIVRNSSKARITAYHVDQKNPQNTRVKLELLSGTARSQSGEAVKLARQNFRFNTPVAAIGVRGTDFTVFTDQDTSRVTVLSGGITISGFDGGACRPDGIGPCEGSAARELSAMQKGVLMQFRRGQSAPQLLPESNINMPPDAIAPPRSDEPGRQGGAAAVPVPGQPDLEVHKNAALQQVASTAKPNEPGNTGGIVTVPPVEPKPVDPVVTPPVVTPPVTPPVPEGQIVWGRWQAVLDQPAQLDFVTESAKHSTPIATNKYFALMRSAGREYTVPERGEIGFTLNKGEAYMLSDNPSIPLQAMTLENGSLNLNFDRRTFTTAFDLVSPSERLAMKAAGDVAYDGRFVADAGRANTMSVNGLLSSEKGGAAAYLFENRFEGTRRTVYGATYWTAAPPTK
ncbi:hypothetical protein GCM10027277_19440 [Pseudoduganella ginsengisoli]|uniref:FecR protein domain-containing protein n=1 Tax=Pseudoduganella ginsengisoli TaxID=1462440 RepID=A0A6L6PTI1_9BURK|nr:FecR domain-containing protein [Pseudoduganella ginsengisoli]MTW00800.1 hypothetical protein [Pseudoduganella ginsengisoli]